ncbi:MAG: hypothetical protein R2909_13620 [Gemmatimonadales bacterium]
MSARLPTVMVPVSSAMPSTLAPLPVTIATAASGEKPASTSSS